MYLMTAIYQTTPHQFDTCHFCKFPESTDFSQLQECQLTVPSSSTPFRPALEQPRAQGMGLLWLPWGRANAMWGTMVQPVMLVLMGTRE